MLFKDSVTNKILNWVRNMKGSTLRRSNLTKEKIAMLDSLARYNNSRNNRIPLDKQEELDVLWQNFKVAPRTEKSPIAFFTTGVFVGVILTLVAAILVSLVIGYSPLDDLNINLTNPIPVTKVESPKFTLIPADTKQDNNSTVSNTLSKEYTVQSGDSLESIAIKFYGGFDEAKIKAIEEANKLANPNAIGIGQKLIIPMN